jgi:hypothetical protein
MPEPARQLQAETQILSDVCHLTAGRLRCDSGVESRLTQLQPQGGRKLLKAAARDDVTEAGLTLRARPAALMRPQHGWYSEAGAAAGAHTSAWDVRCYLSRVPLVPDHSGGHAG